MVALDANMGSCGPGSLENTAGSRTLVPPMAEVVARTSNVHVGHGLEGMRPRLVNWIGECGTSAGKVVAACVR